MEYTNFTIRLFGSKDSFNVEATGPDGRACGPETVRYSQSREDRHTHQSVGDTIKLGAKLGELLLPGEVKEMLLESVRELWGDSSKAERGLRLLLAIEDHWLTTLPWEYVYLPDYLRMRRQQGERAEKIDGFLARDPRISIVRLAHHAATVRSQAPTVLPRDPTVVFSFAEPEDVGHDIDQVSAFLALYLARKFHGLDIHAKFIHRLTLDKLSRLDNASDLMPLIEAIDLAASPLEAVAQERGILKFLLDGATDIVEMVAGTPVADLRQVAEQLEAFISYWEDPEHEMRGVRYAEELAEDTPLAEARQVVETLMVSFSNVTGQELRGDVHVFDFSGHGGLYSENEVDGRGKLKQPPSRREKHEHESPVRHPCCQRALERSHGLASTDVAGMIVLEDEDGKHRIAWAKEVAEKLKARNVSIVVLNSCESAKRSNSSNFRWRSLSATLLEAGIPAVVGMQKTISDHAAISFAFGFYSALAERLSLDEAVAKGRAEILKLEERKTPAKPRRRDSQDWAVPVLYLGTPDSIAFE